MNNNGTGVGTELFSEKVRKALMDNVQNDGGKNNVGATKTLKGVGQQPSFDSNNSSRSGSGTRNSNHRFEAKTRPEENSPITAPIPLAQAAANNHHQSGAIVGSPNGGGGGGQQAGGQFVNAEMFAPSLASPQKQAFSMAKAKMLAKNQSANDLTQYINPDMLIRRRASLHQNAFDPTMKKIRQREAYKTAMCQAWLEGKTCAFGDQCNFAHGEDELQPLPSNRPNPKYKTRICENYTTTGICPFGNRCFFIHPQPASKMDDLLEYQEQLSQTARKLEGEAIFRPATGGALAGGGIGPTAAGIGGGRPIVGGGTPLGGTPNMPRRMGQSGVQNNKAKQFRKLESCGNFYTQYQLQQMQQLQWQQQQQQQQQQEQMARQIEQNFYDNFPPLSAANNKEGTGGGQEGNAGGRKASKNTAVTGSMPLIHSNSSGNLIGNFNFQPIVQKTTNNKESNAPNNNKSLLEERRLTFRKMQSHKSFSSSDVWYQQNVVKPKPLLGMDSTLVGEHRDGDDGGSDSSGPHTPPGFYDKQRTAFGGSSKWSSMSSTHPTHIWPGLDPTGAAAADGHPHQKVPSFSLFGPSEQIGSGNLLRMGGGGQQGQCGKKSPISDFDGVLMGRRSSHTPYLDEGENTQTFLDVVFGGVGEKCGRNKSAEYLLERNRGGQGAGGQSNWLGLDPANSWQMGARSTGALNDQFAPWHTQFGPPEGPSPHSAAANNQTNFWGSGQIMGHGGIGGMEGGGGGGIGSNAALHQLAFLQQQQLMAAGYMNAAAAAAASSGMAGNEFVGSGLLASSFPNSASAAAIGASNYPSAFRPIRQIQQEHFQSPMDHQSPYSSNSSVNANSLADELIRQSQGSLVGSNLDVMRNIWASSSPELDKDYQQQAQENLHSSSKVPLWSELDGTNDQRVEIPSKLDFFSGVLKRNDALERVLKQSKPEALSRNDTLTDGEDEGSSNSGMGQKERQRELNNLCESLGRLETAGVIGSARRTLAGDGSDPQAQGQMEMGAGSILDGYEPGAGAQTWAKRAMKKAFLRQKSHSSPEISRSGSLAEKETIGSVEK